MLLQLIQSLLAALLVLIVPGYLWTGVFIEPADWIERLALAIGISLATVPAIASFLALVSGSGVTVAISVVAVVTVALTGLVATIVVGNRHRASVALPADMLVTRLGQPSLVLFTAALVPAILMILRVVRDRPAAAVAAILVMASGLVYVTRAIQGRADAPSGSAVRQGVAPARSADRLVLTRRLLHPSRSVLVPVLLLLVLFRGYAGPILIDWPYLRGEDQYAHVIMTNLVLANGTAASYALYPPGMHVLTAILSNIAGLSPLRVYALLAPAALLLPAIASYVLAQRVFGPSYALPVVFFAGLVVRGPEQYFNDGAYPQLVSSQFLVLLALALIAIFITSPSRQSAALVAVVGSAVAFYHTVSSAYLVILLTLTCIVVVPLALRRERSTVFLLLTAFAALGAVSTLYAWRVYDLPGAIRSLRAGTTGTPAVAIARSTIGTQPVLPLADLPTYISQSVTWLGLLGIVVVLAQCRRLPARQAQTIWLLLGWTAVLFAASRIGSSGFPSRFARDLGIPLAVFAGFALAVVVRSIRWDAVTSRLAALVLVAVLSVQLQQSLVRASGPGGGLQVMSRDLEAAATWLSHHNDGGTVITNVYFDRAVQALSGYPTLPAVTRDKRVTGRSVYPGDEQKVQDVPWVYEHAAGERTLSILRRYNVHYLVFMKRLPRRMPQRQLVRVRWGKFANRPSWYEIVYQNRSVIIFRVRAQ